MGAMAMAMAVEVAGFSLMDNHVHLLLRVDNHRAEGWSAKEVADRWLKLHPVRDGKYRPIETPEGYVDELAIDDAWVIKTREKLMSISQFMKEFKQAVAQHVNQRENKAGAFWEGRYKVKAVRDVAQLVATLTYIDLNPFAADCCEKPEDGRYTSLEGRLGKDKPAPQDEHVRDAKASSDADSAKQPATCRRCSAAWLVPMAQPYVGKSQKRSRQGKTSRPLLRSLTLPNYLKMLDYAARLMRSDQKKRLPKNTVDIFERLAIPIDRMTQHLGHLQRVWGGLQME